MAIRKIREHAAAHNWFAVAIDILIVFIGVFLGIQANNWNEARLAEAATRTDRMRLVHDLRTNEVDLEGRLVYYESARQHALKALQGFSNRDASLGEAFLVNAYQASQIRQRPMRRFTYDELVSTGSLARISEPELREQLDLYYLGLTSIDENIRNVPPYRDRIRREMPYEAQQGIRSRCGEQVREAKGAVIRSLPPLCRTGLERGVISDAVARLRAAPEMDRDLTRYITDIDQKLDAYRRAKERARELREGLQTSLGPKNARSRD
jgi:hypothetical protein